MNAPTLTPSEVINIQRRLDRWELAHLRSLAASLDDQLQAAIRRADTAEAQAEDWMQHAQQLQEELLALADESNIRIGLTQRGNVIALRPEVSETAAGGA